MAWWAVYSEPGRTLLARDEMIRRDIRVFCPVERLTRKRKISNRNKYRAETLTVPVFGRYLFAEGGVGSILATRGVMDVVRMGSEPLPVPCLAIEELRVLTQADDCGDLMSRRDLTRLSLGFSGEVGDTFKFDGGPFSGFLGQISSIARLDACGEIKAFVELLGGRCEVAVQHSFVGPIVVKVTEPTAIAA